MKSGALVAFSLFSILVTSARGAPHPLGTGEENVAMQARQRCTIAFWDYWRNPNNCELIYPGFQGTANPTPTPRPTSTSTRSTTSARSTTTTTRSTTTVLPTSTTATATTTSTTTIVVPTSLTTSTSATTTTTTTVTAPTTATSGIPVPTVTTPASTTTTVSTTPLPTGALTADQQTALARSNQYRAIHGVRPFTWDASLAASAQAVANTCVFEHTPGDYGENLAAGTGTYSYNSAIDAWYNEITKYNFATPGFSTATGHFTQLIWASSTLVGCARNTQCTPQQLGFGTGFGSQATFIVCQYRPPGNVIGSFAANVLPPL
ncbi:sterol-binding protein [Tilletia horrida]|uniref:Sterol-binding protein n=1 Tax=Tilletia horrida TaxID=155126 RepID=A0AAN6GC50_9BASI|nr:sterol-binding protein [Tilletia horrida]